KGTRSRALGTHQTSVYAGTIAGGFFAGLIGQYYGWRWSFVIFGALGVHLGLFLSRFLVEPARGAAEIEDQQGVVPLGPAQRLSVRATLSLLSRTPTLLILMLAFMCANFVAMVLLSWMPMFLSEKFDL